MVVALPLPCSSTQEGLPKGETQPLALDRRLVAGKFDSRRCRRPWRTPKTLQAEGWHWMAMNFSWNHLESGWWT